MASNPFHDLYLSEAISEDDVVNFFSPIIVKYSGIVFEPGNVIITGLQGTGKTMLLNLLRPELRLAYRKANIPFPVADRASKFIGAGINLRKCGILEFAQHLEPDMEAKQVQELALLFADFFNYWIVGDLLASLQQIILCDYADVKADVGLIDNQAKLDEFAQILANDPCWFEAMREVTNFFELSNAISKRISTYRKFLNLNIDELPREILTTKTVIGDPVLKAVDALRRSGLLLEKTKVFIRVDQYEQLTTLNIAGTQYGSRCRELIHKALAARDGRVSYRIGTRTYGWDERPTIYRTDDVLERKRDFDIHDMDELFRRRENRKTWLFPEFAQDIFSRRIRNSEYGIESESITTTLGKTASPASRAESYVTSSDTRRRLIESALDTISPAVSDSWKNHIRSLANEDVLAAWLTCAWVRQKIGGKRNMPLGEPPATTKLAWTAKPYWHKERVQLGLMQLASANRQAPMWSGESDVLSLSDGQILLFLFVLQHIWDAWLRDRRGEEENIFQLPIRQEVQSQGVREASSEWRSKQSEGPNAYKRKIFVDSVGQHLYLRLSNDRSMSNPGANGFSVENGELDQNVDVKKFLMDAVSYGDLIDSDHTSKTKGERRTKYYLSSILSPYFRIPNIHTKEPEYVSIKQVRQWMGEGEIIAARENKQARGAMGGKVSPQQQLWDGDD
jgi:hypothetical protein